MIKSALNYHLDITDSLTWFWFEKPFDSFVKIQKRLPPAEGAALREIFITSSALCFQIFSLVSLLRQVAASPLSQWTEAACNRRVNTNHMTVKSIQINGECLDQTPSVALWLQELKLLFACSAAPAPNHSETNTPSSWGWKEVVS